MGRDGVMLSVVDVIEADRGMENEEVDGEGASGVCGDVKDAGKLLCELPFARSNALRPRRA